MADDELWHVRMSPDEVKQLTLEKLDDLFRLELIEADTLIWQPGMTEWLPLSVVAGLGEEDPAPVSIRVSEAPRAPAPAATTASSWPPPAAWSNPPPRAAPAAWSNPPPRTAPTSAFASTIQGPPVHLSSPPSVAPVSYAPDPFASHAAAFTTSPAFRVPATQRSGGGGWMIVLALAAGAAVTLYRNDLVHAAARSVGQEGAYLKLETALGGPGFGTPRAVQEMAASAALITAAATAAAANTTATTTTTAEPASTATAVTTAPSPTAAPTSDSAQPSAPSAKTEPSEPTKAAAPARPAAASRPASHSSSPSSDAIDPVFKTSKKGKKAKGNEYDPLNPSL